MCQTRPGQDDGCLHSPSEVSASVSLVLQLSYMSHRRTVLSQEALARMDFIGLKHRPLMGPSWPDKTCSSVGSRGEGERPAARPEPSWKQPPPAPEEPALTSRSLPVCMDHTKISKESWAPAQTISPLESTATQENCVGRGDVNVRKLRYLSGKGADAGHGGRGHAALWSPQPRGDSSHLCRSKARTVPSMDEVTMT